MNIILLLLVLAAVLAYTSILILALRRMRKDIFDQCIRLVDAADRRRINSEITMMAELGYWFNPKFAPDGSLRVDCWSKIGSDAARSDPNYPWLTTGSGINSGKYDSP